MKTKQLKLFDDEIDTPDIAYKCDLESSDNETTTLIVNGSCKRDAVVKASQLAKTKFPKKDYVVVETNVTTEDDGKFEINSFNPDIPNDEYTKIKKEMTERKNG